MHAVCFCTLTREPACLMRRLERLLGLGPTSGRLPITPLPPPAVVVKGFRDMNSRYQSYSEFLFQLPRRLLSNEKEKLVLSDQERDDLKKHLETIKCEFFGCQAEYTKEEYDGVAPLRPISLPCALSPRLRRAF